MYQPCLAALLLFASASVNAGQAALAQVGICDDEKLWPPSTFINRTEGSKQGQLTGYSIDLVRALFAQHGIKVNIDLMPWARCLAEVNKGERYQMVLNVGMDPLRRSQYYLSAPYYTISYHYFYSRRQHPAGLPIHGASDLHKHKVCGMLNYDQAVMGFAPGEVDSGAANYGALVAKLHLGRCALFELAHEVALGFVANGETALADPDLASAPIPGFARGTFHLAVSRQAANGAAIFAVVEKELRAMAASGQLDALWQHYLPGTPLP